MGGMGRPRGMGGGGGMMGDSGYQSYRSDHSSGPQTYTIENKDGGGFFRSTTFLVTFLVLAVVGCLCFTTVCMYAEE